MLVSARNADHARAAAKDLGTAGDVRTLEVDLIVTDDASVGMAARALEDDPGRLDVPINNAAAYVDWAETASSVTARHPPGAGGQPVRCPAAHQRPAAAAAMESDHPRIVNVSSGAGSHRDDQFGLAAGWTAASYGISKAALNALTSTLAAELADTPILVNAVPRPDRYLARRRGQRPAGGRGRRLVLWAATLPDDGPTGESRRDGRPLPW